MVGGLHMAPLPAGGVYVDRAATVKRHGFGGPLLAQALENSKFALLFLVPESRSCWERTRFRPWLEASELFARDVGRNIRRPNLASPRAPTSQTLGSASRLSA